MIVYRLSVVSKNGDTIKKVERDYVMYNDAYVELRKFKTEPIEDVVTVSIWKCTLVDKISL